MYTQNKNEKKVFEDGFIQASPPKPKVIAQSELIQTSGRVCCE